MEKCRKSSLQELCQKNHLPAPIYRCEESRDENGKTQFQGKVDVNNRWYTDTQSYTRKKDAEKSVAAIAYKDLNFNLPPTERAQQELDYQTMQELDLRRHLPAEYADIEDFFVHMVGSVGGRIRRVSQIGGNRKFRIEITGSYRYCENIQRNHNHNKIYFIVDPVKRIYSQKCYDPECHGFQTAYKPITTNTEQQ